MIYILSMSSLSLIILCPLFAVYYLLFVPTFDFFMEVSLLLRYVVRCGVLWIPKI
jgi:hypothetical protein